MSAHEIHDQKAIARELFVQEAAHDNADVSAGLAREDTICSIKSRRDYRLESTAEEGFYKLTDTSLLPLT